MQNYRFQKNKKGIITDYRFGYGYWQQPIVVQADRIWLTKYGFMSNGLDVGCGIGRLMTKNMIGITLSDYEVKVCKDKGLNAIRADARNIPFCGNTFSEILCAFVLEHMLPLDAVKVMNECYRVLKFGGHAFFLTEQFNKVFNHDYTHIHPFTKASIQQIMLDGGFREISILRIMPMIKGYNFIGKRMGENILYVIQLITRIMLLRKCKLLAIGIKE